MAHHGQDDLPVLPSNFFNDPAQTGNWSWEADFKDVVEIGKGKVRQRCGGGGTGRGVLAAAAVPRTLSTTPCTCR